MFWSMLELGIAMVASCLPILRPLFNDFSAESVINSIRSALSLNSLGSQNRSLSAPKGPYHQSESETAITLAPAGSTSASVSASAANKKDWNPTSTVDSIDVEAYAMGRIDNKLPDRITRETEVTQTLHDV
jgi:hypothetical protein